HAMSTLFPYTTLFRSYHGAKLRHYQDLIDSCITKETSILFSDARTGNLAFDEYHVLNMLNVKYIVFGQQRDNMFVNPAANGSAWFVQNVITVNSPTEELKQVCDADTKTTAVIDVSKFTVKTSPSAVSRTIKIITHSPH